MSDHPIIAPKKLIEVALPLDEINKAAAREKSIRHGHPSTLHLWWARRPLAAARAVLFAQLVNDPSWKYSEEELKKPQIRSVVTRKRNELFKLITRLVQWENTNNEDVLEQARKEIRASWKETCEANKNHPNAQTLFNPETLPAFHDPFAGGGTIPLEAQRLGLEAHATDLNPVAVLINKAMIEIPPKFAGRPPVGPAPTGEKQTKATAVEDWSGAKGLAEDVRRYGTWMREEAEKRIGHLYPKVEITKEMAKERPDLKQYVGQKLTVIAWLWARTVKSPNPAFSHVHVPLVSTFVLAAKEGKESWIEPVIEKDDYRFEVRLGTPPKEAADGTVNRAGGTCILSKVAIPFSYIRSEAKAAGFGAKLMAVVAQGPRARIYLSPPADHTTLFEKIVAPVAPTIPISHWPGRTNVVEYGLTAFAELFTPRQLTSLTTLSDLIVENVPRICSDAVAAGMTDDRRGLDAGGTGARAYAEAVAICLSFVLSKVADGGSTLCRWMSQRDSLFNTFSKQALPMIWDFAEINMLADCTRSWSESLRWTVESVGGVCGGSVPGFASQADAQTQHVTASKVLSTDPPYYDNIGYADLSDYFYLWLRRTLGKSLPSIFGTLAVPKAEELVAQPYRHGSRARAEEFFLDGMTRAMRNLAEQASPAFPATVFYAFKQSDTKDEKGTSSTGWETFLQAMLDAGFGLTGTWPMRTERDARSISIGANALASSIVLVGRPRSDGATTVARKDFLRQLERALPAALAEMTADPEASVAPVDLAQACIGPGMAIFSRYRSVLEANGEPMSVRNALVHINKAVDNHFAHVEGDLDADTRFCVGWFQQYGFEPGVFGEADVLARAKGTSVDGVKEAGAVSSGKGKVRLLKVKEYPKSWDPKKDHRTPVWEACHQMCRALAESERSAGELLARMPEKQDAIRQLAYRLYTICERKKWADEARSYNELITSWPAIVEHSVRAGHIHTQLDLLS